MHTWEMHAVTRNGHEEGHFRNGCNSRNPRNATSDMRHRKRSFLVESTTLSLCVGAQRQSCCLDVRRTVERTCSGFGDVQKKSGAPGHFSFRRRI